MPDLVDIGVNLCDKSFASDLAEVMRAAREAGVSRMVVTGTSVAGSERAANLAARFPGQLWSTAGIHPHHASEFDEHTTSALRTLAARDEVVAIGECGLDYNRNFSTPEEQRRSFAAHLELASELGMPLFLHERDAKEDQLRMLKEVRDRIPKAVIHCFTGDSETLKAYLALDLHIGITGWICDERRGTHLRDIVGTIPENRLMLETDAPYLMPRTIRPRPKSRRNVPANLPYVLDAVAEARGTSREELAAATTKVALEFFGLD